MPKTKTLATSGTPTVPSPNYILLSGVIDMDMWMVVQANLLDYQRAGPADIIVRICSRGGDSAAAFGIYDILKASPNRIITEAWGECSSAGVLILQAGAERRLSPSTMLLLHNGRATIEATMKKDDFRLGAKALSSLDDMYTTIIAGRAGLPVDRIKKLSSKETYLNATEALRLGLADKLTGK